MGAIVSYKRLWKLLIDKNMTRAELRRLTGVSSGTMVKLRKSESVSTEVLWKICSVLHCSIEDIMEFQF